ncbi:HDIG domain-containing protein [bacterium]|nr:HDIG domain-containing protein [bacterium]
MAKDLLNFGSQKVLRYIYIAVTLLIIIALIPTNQKFKYDFELGKPWQYEDLLAPFSFPVLKSDEKIAEEKQNIMADFEPYYEVVDDIEKKAVVSGEQYLEENIGQYGLDVDIEKYKKALTAVVHSIYQTGLIELDPKHRENENFKRLQLIRNKVAKTVSVSGLYTLQNVKEVVAKKAAGYSGLNLDLLTNAIRYGLQPNIVYATEISQEKLNEELSHITQYEGLVSAGELIIQKGLTVTEKEYNKLNSLKIQYEELVKTDGQTWHIMGYIVLVVVIFFIYIGYIQLFQIELIRRNRRLLLMLLNIILFVFLTRYVIQHSSLNVFIIPFCIIPIVTIAFFDYKLALISHIVVVLIAGSFVPSQAAEFIIIQLIAGFAAILNMIRVQYLSQFFISALLIFASYIATYSSFQFIKISSISEFDYTTLLWLSGNFMLTLLAYPLIYAYEKMFGFVSDITLVELSDVNKKLLRKLSVRAPGTFQHSLQVANLAESVINRIGGKPLLTRVGALYHDIGKMENPEYFIENQKYIDNPHDALDDAQSARVIIEHVTNGVKIARQNNLPKVIIEFIQTHHGTSRVEYFYRNYLKKVPADQVDETKFRYPGPRPATREMAVVMICDGIEAATRSIKDKNQGTLSRMIDGIIDGKINDGQLQEAPLTLKELDTTRNVLKELINSMYHVRIEYPDQAKPAGHEAQNGGGNNTAS